MADVDRFKSINDTYGHSFGDEVLRAVAYIFTEICRAEDIVCRYGGEEFTILLPNTPLAGAAELAERMRLAIEARPFSYRADAVSVTCSFGVANLRASIPPSILELADQALYSAKHSGRNRVEICPTSLLVEA
jgi:two-component system cell cycle response regulator